MNILQAIKNYFFPPKPETATFEIVRHLTIVVMDLRKLRWKFKDNKLLGKRIGDTIYTHWSGEIDKNGRPLPNMSNLGHEVWHDPKLGGSFD